MTDRVRGMSNPEDINDINEIIAEMEFLEFGNPHMLSLETMRRLVQALETPSDEPWDASTDTPDPEWDGTKWVEYE